MAVSGVQALLLAVALSVAEGASRVPPVLGASHLAMATLGQAGGGACGFAGFPAATMFQAGLSSALYQGGALCGACLRVACSRSVQCRAGAVVVQVTNLCSATNATSVCVDGNPALNLQPQAWDRIVSSRSPGVASIVFQQVACPSAGGLQFQVRDATPMYFSVLIQNVGGPGSLSGVDVAFGAGAWKPMVRSYGAVWALNGAWPKGVAVSFRLSSGLYQVVARAALPASWRVGQVVYKSPLNF